MGRCEEAEARGRRAEALAASWLRAKGYTFLARKLKLHAGEIDLVARKDDVICFIEVKERATPGQPNSGWHSGRDSRIAAGATTSSPWRRELAVTPAGCLATRDGLKTWASAKDGQEIGPFKRGCR